MKRLSAMMIVAFFVMGAQAKETSDERKVWDRNFEQVRVLYNEAENLFKYCREHNLDATSWYWLEKDADWGKRAEELTFRLYKLDSKKFPDLVLPMLQIRILSGVYGGILNGFYPVSYATKFKNEHIVPPLQKAIRYHQQK